MKQAIMLLILLSIASLSFAEPMIRDGKLKRIDGDKSTMYVEFSWKAVITSGEKRTCMFMISLRDGEQMEFSSVVELVDLKSGRNVFTGTGIVKSEHWFKMKSSPMSLNCRDL